MKKIAISQKKLQLKKDKVARLTKAGSASVAASHVEPTTTVLLTIQHKCLIP